MPMEDTDIPCPDCGKMLTDVDGMLECQPDYAPNSPDDMELKLITPGCGGSTGFTEEDWGVWYPGKGMRENPKRLTFDQRAEENARLRIEAERNYMLTWIRQQHGSYFFPIFLRNMDRDLKKTENKS